MSLDGKYRGWYEIEVSTVLFSLGVPQLGYLLLFETQLTKAEKMLVL